MTSTIEYDRDHPHEMKMVWEAWLKTAGYLLTEAQQDEVLERWLAGKSEHGVTYGLIIDQKVWSRIVATYL